MVKLKKDCNTGGCDNVFSCCYWKEKINKAWELATTSIRSIKVNGGEPQYPDGDGSVDVRVTVDTTEIRGQIDAISAEVDQLTEDVLDNSTDIINLSNMKENVLSAGSGIDIDRASSSTPIISTNVVAQNSDGMFSVWKDESKIAELTEGENVTISPTGEVSAVDTKYTAGANVTITADGVISAVDTKYTAGTNVTITADGVISATGELSGTASAAQIIMDDNRSVQSAIDAIEDEIGDSTTGGTIQSRLEALEESTANLDTEMAGKQDNLTETQMDAVNSGITATKVAEIGSTSASVAQLGSRIDTAEDDITALKSADVKLSTAYNSFEVDKATAGRVALTMHPIDNGITVTSNIVTAGEGVSIDNGVISTNGGSGPTATTFTGSTTDDLINAIEIGHTIMGSILKFTDNSNYIIKLSNMCMTCIDKTESRIKLQGMCDTYLNASNFTNKTYYYTNAFAQISTTSVHLYCVGTPSLTNGKTSSVTYCYEVLSNPVMSNAEGITIY